MATGVYYDKRFNRWYAKAPPKTSGDKPHLGCFKTQEEAILARQNWEKENNYVQSVKVNSLCELGNFFEIKDSQLVYKFNTTNNKAGSAAGYKDKFGYIRIGVILGGKHKSIKAHKIVWCLHNKEWPTDQLDHLNHNRSDNRIENLRLTNNQGNQQNTGMRKRNKSGYMGVYKSQTPGKWCACISVSREKIHLGTFTSPEEARIARKEADKKHGFHPNHGENK